MSFTPRARVDSQRHPTCNPVKKNPAFPTAQRSM
jgi:hypothetical protein